MNDHQGLIQECCYRGLRRGFQVFTAIAFGIRCFGRHHVPDHGGVLLACNHQSFLDPVIVALGLHRQATFLARDSLFRHPAFGRLITFLNAFPVKRNTADLAAIKESLRRLKKGRLLILFGEGTRSRDGTIAPLQPGTMMLARKANVPVVPVVVDGAFEAWPRNRRIIRCCPIRVSYGPPMSPGTILEYGDQRAARTLWRRQIQMQNCLRRRYGKTPYSYPPMGELP